MGARPGVAMKPALLDILVCPRCVASLDLRTDAGDGIEVHEGTLRCPVCGRNYPITGGVPRFVDSGSYAASFGRQWQWFRRVQLDSQSGSDESARTLEATTGWTEADYRGRLVLDAGVGAGRYAEVVANQGGRGGRRGPEPRGGRGVPEYRPAPQCAPRAGRHHGHALSRGRRSIWRTPSACCTTRPIPSAPSAAWPAVVRKGGALAVYVYARYGPSHRFSDAIRRVTTRLPLARAARGGGAGGARVLPLSRARDRRAARHGLPDLPASGLAVALAGHLRLVLAEVPVEGPVPRGRSGGFSPMASGTSSSSTGRSACAARRRHSAGHVRHRRHRQARPRGDGRRGAAQAHARRAAP